MQLVLSGIVGVVLICWCLLLGPPRPQMSLTSSLQIPFFSPRFFLLVFSWTPLIMPVVVCWSRWLVRSGVVGLMGLVRPGAVGWRGPTGLQVVGPIGMGVVGRSSCWWLIGLVVAAWGVLMWLPVGEV